jgi:hypothetical protein
MGDEELRVKITVQGGEQAKKALDSATTSSKTLTKTFSNLIPGVKDATSKIDDLAGITKELGPTIGISAEASAGLATQMAALAPVIGAVVVAIGVAVAALAGLKTAIDLAVDAAPLESIQLGFDLSAKRATAMGDDVLAAMQKASGGTIEAEALMKKFNDASMLVSPDFALMLTDALEPLQKVAATTGESMDYLTSSFVTGVGRLSKPILDNLRITVDTEKAYAQYARTLGKATDALTKQEQQMALANYTIEQLKANTAGLPSVTQTASGIMQSFAASARDLRKALGLSVLPILTEVLRVFGVPLRTAMQTAARGFRAVGNVLKNTLNQPEVREALDGLSASLSELFGQSMQAAMKTIVALVTRWAQNWARTGPQTIKTITAIVNELSTLAVVINRVLDAMNQLGLIKTTAKDLTAASIVAGYTPTKAPNSGGIMTYAGGTNFHPGGLAIVGDRGPEVVNLPRGSQVYPSGSANMGGMRIYGPISITAPSDGSLAALMHNMEAAATATV